MITIYILGFRTAYQTTNCDVADKFVKFIQALGLEVSTELTQSTEVIDGILKVR